MAFLRCRSSIISYLKSFYLFFILFFFLLHPHIALLLLLFFVLNNTLFRKMEKVKIAIWYEIGWESGNFHDETIFFNILQWFPVLSLYLCSPVCLNFATVMSTSMLYSCEDVSLIDIDDDIDHSPSAHSTSPERWDVKNRWDMSEVYIWMMLDDVRMTCQTVSTSSSRLMWRDS